jgi:GT2 family glycosyltransferase
MVTAIIVNYHSHQLAIRAAASVLADQPDAQIVVVDNSESEAEAQALHAALPAGVECLVSPENIGFGRACNLGYSHARYEWILLLNPDALVLDGCIAELVGFLQKTPRAGAVAPLVYWDVDQTWLAPPILMHTPFTEAGMAILLRWPWLGNKISHIFRRWALGCVKSEQPVERAMLSGGHLLLRRSALEAVGGLFDPAFFMYFEDTDLCRRLSQSGSQLYLLTSARAVHEWHCTQDKTEVSAASRQHYFNKHFLKSRFLALRMKLDQSALKIRLPLGTDLGVCCTAPVFSVPECMKGGWVLELSPQPLLIPALYCFGSGREAYISEELWCRLGPGDYWVRITSPSDGNSYRFHFGII